MAQATKRDCGFVISTYDENMIRDIERDRTEENAGTRNILHRMGLIDAANEITELGWAQLSRDILKLENNALAWLRDKFPVAYDEGHDSHGDLVGTVFFSTRSKLQMELIELGKDERIDMTDGSYGDLSKTVWQGVSDFGQDVLGGQINFFDTGL
jgi:hypothetical protein